MNIIKRIFRVASANGIQVLSGILLGFLLPKFLSIDEYASYKTFTLYVAYIGLLHLGFPDGLYVDYGGKAFDKLDKKQLKGEFYFFFVMELGFTILLVIPSLILKSWIGVMIAIAILPYNINTFFKRLYQSTDQLPRYSNTILIYSIVETVFTLIFIFLFKAEDALFYCLIPIFANAVICVSEGTRLCRRICGEKLSFDFTRYKALIKSGFIILIGNLAVNLFYGIDRWTVKLFFSDADFSYYSFAVSMLNIATTILQAISISLFASFANGTLIKRMTITKDLLLVVGTLASAVYFLLSIFVSFFLPDYMASLGIISITMAIFPYLLYINAVTINLYKAQHQERHYVIMIVIMLGIAIIGDLAVVSFKRMELVALMTLVCYIIWYWISRAEKRELDHIKFREVAYLIVCTGAFLCCSELDTIIGLIIYIGIWIISSFIYMLRYIRNKSLREQ